jgi:hypothetical protein
VAIRGMAIIAPSQAAALAFALPPRAFLGETAHKSFEANCLGHVRSELCMHHLILINC